MVHSGGTKTSLEERSRRHVHYTWPLEILVNTRDGGEDGGGGSFSRHLPGHPKLLVGVPNSIVLSMVLNKCVDE